MILTAFVDFFAPEGVTHVGARWLSHSCGPGLGGVYDKCTLGKARHTTEDVYCNEAVHRSI